MANEVTRMALGSTVRKLRKAAGLTQEELGDNVGVDRSYISQIETGVQAIPSMGVLRALARELHAVFGELLNDALGADGRILIPSSSPIPGMTSAVSIQVVSEVSAGGGFMPSEEWIAISPPGTASRHIVAFRVRGDCMGPQIAHGDYVVVDLEREWRDDDIVLARIDGDILVKRAFAEDRHVRLHPDALGYSDVLDQGTDVLGVVVLVVKTPV
jgi:transcriptional regulator with XRE-family HTH domain